MRSGSRKGGGGGGSSSTGGAPCGEGRSHNGKEHMEAQVPPFVHSATTTRQGEGAREGEGGILTERGIERECNPYSLMLFFSFLI